MLELTLSGTLVTGDLVLGVLDLAGIWERVGGWPGRYGIILVESDGFDGELHSFVFVYLTLLDSLGYSILDLLTSVITGSRHLECKSHIDLFLPLW